MNISKIQLLGPFNTGTNLLTNILKQNIKEDIKIHWEGHTLFWKHAINKSLIEKYIKSNTDTLFICIYKSLHNWISSMQKSSYNIKWDKTLTGKCHFVKEIHNEISYEEKYYKNIILIYNEYYNMYMQLINNHNRVIFMNYYDIIDKKNVVKYITNKLFVYNLSIKSDNNIFSILDKPSKNHGGSVNSVDEAINKKNKSYNNINNCEKNKLIIKEHFNYEIRDFFEN